MFFIRLEKFDNQDYDTLIGWVDSAEMLMQFAGPAFTFPLTKEQLDRSLTDSNRFAFKVADAVSEAMIGYAEIFVAEKCAYLGRVLIGDPQLRGKGIGQKIVQQLIAFAFVNLNQERVELNVFEWNTPAIKCYEKAGFTLNPARKAERFVNGKEWCALNMAIDKQT